MFLRWGMGVRGFDWGGLFLLLVLMVMIVVVVYISIPTYILITIITYYLDMSTAVAWRLICL